jgi:hypothetical protein
VSKNIMKYAVKAVGCDVWTLAYELVGKNKVRIESHTRDNRVGYDYTVAKPVFALVEDDYRLAVGVVINKVQYEVVNPYDVYKPKPTWVN